MTSLPTITPGTGGEILLRILSRYYKWQLQDHPTNIYVLNVTTPDGFDFAVDYRVKPSYRYFDVKSEAMRLYYWPSLLSSSSVSPLQPIDDWDDMPAMSTTLCDKIASGKNISHLFIRTTCQLTGKTKAT